MFAVTALFGSIATDLLVPEPYTRLAASMTSQIERQLSPPRDLRDVLEPELAAFDWPAPYRETGDVVSAPETSM